MGQAKQRGTKEQRIEAAIKNAPIVLSPEELQAQWEASLPYKQRIQMHNIKVIKEALLSTPANYV